MATITIPKSEYQRLKQHSSAYFRIVEEITKTELAHPYDYKYINTLTKQALKEFKEKKSIEAKSANEALAKFKKRKK